MSAARLILKQPTGWSAAGREVAQALALLSDGAFKLYIHLCLEADRHTGRAVIEPAAWTRILRKDAASIDVSLGELYLRKVCERRGNRVEICARFWPYQKQVTVSAVDPEADFVRQVREAFLTAADERLALNLCRRGAGLEQLRRAIWMGCARKYVAMLNGQTRLPITSLVYFASLIDEVAQPQIPASYWDHVRRRIGGNGKALVANRERGHGAGSRCRSSRTITAGNDLITCRRGNRNRLPPSSGALRRSYP